MKKTRRFLSIMLIAVMTFCLSAFSASADDFTITVTNENTAVSIDGIEYKAYKVFNVTFDLSADAYTYSTDNTCLSTNYGSYNINNISESNAQEFGNYVYTTFIKDQTVADTVNQGSATASGQSAVITVPSAGYYVVFGTAKNLSGNAGDDVVTSLVMLDTASPDANVKTKLDAPSLTKKIQHNDDDSWGVVGDNQIGDVVNFRLESKVPDLNGYSDYTYVIHDTMTSGLGFNQGSVSVKVNDTDVLASSYYTVNAVAGGQALTVDFDINKAVTDGVIAKNDVLYTYYSATLNTSALVSGGAVDTTNHNDNTAYLEYSNNPYDTSSNGRTPDSKVYDWTYQFTINKVDKNGNPLKGAGFTVKDNDTVIKFTKKDGTNYVVDPNGSVTEIVTDATGSFTILGLDDNTKYTLEETTVPSGYSKCEDVDVTFASTYNTDGNELSTLTATVNNAKEHSGLTAKIENLSGSKLVGTGGIGTTVFYVVGGVIMVGAAVILITRKRMKNKGM
ncbi:SpaA isopeptide-forming pilin-related protein [Porcipelethomonas sp.]|uniref:SpaA isopeptide-forming pilin-related protein n=1 Tax=Porcipelethomonas sp. TaxID=2981675 RepID=UPI003EF72490